LLEPATDAAWKLSSYQVNDPVLVRESIGDAIVIKSPAHLSFSDQHLKLV
jgi:hypothetical protein